MKLLNQCKDMFAVVQGKHKVMVCAICTNGFLSYQGPIF